MQDDVSNTLHKVHYKLTFHAKLTCLAKLFDRYLGMLGQIHDWSTINTLNKKNYLPLFRPSKKKTPLLYVERCSTHKLRLFQYDPLNRFRLLLTQDQDQSLVLHKVLFRNLHYLDCCNPSQ